MLERIKRNLGANIIAQAVNISTQLLQIPLLLIFWSAETVGLWLMLTAVPAYFATADLGVLATTSNSLVQHREAGDIDLFTKTWHSAVALVLIGSALLMSIGLASVISLSTGATSIVSANELALVALVIGTYLGLVGGLLEGAFRVMGRTATGVLFTASIRAIEFCALISAVAIFGTVLAAAIAGTLARVLGVSFEYYFVTKSDTILRFRVMHANLAVIKKMIRDGVSFMAFGIGNALQIQGVLLLVGTMLGPAFATAFSAMRTLSRIAVQISTIVNRSVWPEFTLLGANGKYASIIELQRKTILGCLIISVPMAFFLYFAGEILIELWTHGKAEFHPAAFDFFLVSAVLCSAWQCPMVTLSAINRHHEFSVRYLGVMCGSVAGVWLALQTANYSQGIARSVFIIALADGILLVLALRSTKRIFLLGR